MWKTCPDSILPKNLCIHIVCTAKMNVHIHGCMFLLRFPDSGEVYCWGHGKKGQCGILTDGKPQLKYTAPVKG